MIELPPAPPDGMYWLRDADSDGWRLVMDDGPEVIRDINMSGGTGG